MKVDSSEYLSQNEAVALYRLSTVTFWRERRNGKLPFYRVRGKILYKRTDLDAYMEANRRDLSPYTAGGSEND